MTTLGTLSIHLDGTPCKVACSFCYLGARRDGGGRIHLPLLTGALGTLRYDEVAVAVRVREMPPRDAVFEMRVGHIPQLLERLQVPIHGRGIDLRMLRADPRGDVVRGDVMLCALERFEHQAALDRHALAARADVLADLH